MARSLTSTNEGDFLIALNDGMKHDSRGLAVTGASDAAIAALDRFADAAVSLKPGMAEILDAARANPECAMVQAYAGALYGLSQSNLEARSGLPYLNQARKHFDALTDRERIFIDAVSAGCDGDFETATALYGQLIDRWPRDILAAKIAEFHCFETGDAARQLSIMERMAPANGDSPHAQAMYAFALELNGLRDRAEQVSLNALAQDGESMWAQHCLAHVYGEQARVAQGIAALEKYAPTWSRYSQYIQSHNWFHLATLYLAQLDFGRVLDAYRDHIWGFQPKEVVEHTDAILLLWYIEMAGGDAGDRWRKLAPYIIHKAHEQVFPFLTTIYLYALERAGESAEVDRAMKAMADYAQRQAGRAAHVWQKIGLAEARGSTAFARGDYDRAAELLGEALTDIAAGGGSDEQRGVFPQAHFLSLHRAGQKDAARRALNTYLAERAATPLHTRWIKEIAE
jgi:tetratricopeptide (TPR) repeat protein